MTKYDGGDDDGDNDGNKDGNKDGNEDGNDDNNAASGPGYDGPIFDPTTTPRYQRGGSGDDGDGAVAHYVSTRRTIYLPYEYHIKDMPYTAVCKHCRFGLVLLKHEKITSSINTKIDYIFEMYSDSPLIECPSFSLILTVRCLTVTNSQGLQNGTINCCTTLVC